MRIVLIIVGALLGAAVDEGTGVLLGGLLGWLLWRSLQQQREIAALRDRLSRATPTTPAVALPSPRPAPAAEAAWVPQPKLARTAVDVPIDTVPGVLPPAGADAAAAPAARAAAADDDGPTARTPPAAPPPRAPGFVDAARAWLFGGNTIVKAGVLILFIGLAFLAKYASEHVQLPIELRLAAIGAVAIVLLAVGWRLRTRRAGYAQVLQGGAIAVLYLTLFAAFRFYGVIGGVAAFALMAAVAALAAALAVLQDARSLAVVGALGGFATPLLLSTGGGSHVALFSYYLVLDLGVAAVAWYRTWRPLVLIAFFFTFGVGAAWGALKYTPADYTSAQAFLVVFFLLFVAVMLMPARRLAPASDGKVAEPPTPQSERWVNGSLLFGLPTIAFALQYGLVHDTRYGVALSALVLAAFYVLLARALRARPRLALAFEGSLAVGTVFLTLVIPFALDERATAGAWALEGAGLVWLGWRQARRLARGFGYALLAVAALLLFHVIDRDPPPVSLVNATLLSGLMLVAGALLGALFVQRHASAGPAFSGERLAEPVLIALSLLASFAVSLLHVRALLEPSSRLAAILACLAGIALLHAVLARRLAWPGVAQPLMGYAPLLLLIAVASSVLDRPYAHGRGWAWLIALAVQAWVLRSVAASWPVPARHAVHAIGALVVGTLGALAGRDLMRNAGDLGSAWPWLGWLAAPALLLLVLPRASLAVRWPLRELPEAYQRSAGAVIAAALLLWTLLANVVSNGAAAPLPYVPLLNPLDLGIALALFAAWRWAESASVRDWLPRPHTRWPLALLGAFSFVWLNAMLVRGFHHLGGVRFAFDAWTRSLPVQTGLTLLWTATALPLMWWSARRGQRAPWMAGAALLAAVVLKLLLVDLSASGTVTRIVSFIGAGVLMLVIGYVAPLPGRGGRHAKA